jgi:hypothetical protein
MIAAPARFAGHFEIDLDSALSAVRAFRPRAQLIERELAPLVPTRVAISSQTVGSHSIATLVTADHSPRWRRS